MLLGAARDSGAANLGKLPPQHARVGIRERRVLRQCGHHLIDDVVACVTEQRLADCCAMQRK